MAEVAETQIDRKARLKIPPQPVPKQDPKERVKSCAVAAGATSIARTSTIPSTWRARTTVSAMRTSSPYCIAATGTPLAAAIEGS